MENSDKMTELKESELESAAGGFLPSFFILTLSFSLNSLVFAMF